jgi:hypothetical protein
MCRTDVHVVAYDMNGDDGWRNAISMHIITLALIKLIRVIVLLVHLYDDISST